MEKRTTRFSGAEWADQLRVITIVGVGGIGSWLAFNLSRIGHELIIIDPDTVDETNVYGGQMYRSGDVGNTKVGSVRSICREFGTGSYIQILPEYFQPDLLETSIVITGLDSMAPRRQVYEAWKANMDHGLFVREESLLIDGRLTMEMYEILAVQGTRKDQMEIYDKEHLFTDEEAEELDCTTKQSTFGAMGIAAAMTATLCNFLTNVKIGDPDFRDVPFYNRMYYPLMGTTRRETESVCQQTEPTEQTEQVEVTP